MHICNRLSRKKRSWLYLNSHSAVCTIATVSASMRSLCITHFRVYFSALKLQFCWGPARVKSSLQPVCPSEVSTARIHMGRGLDCRVDGKTVRLAGHQRTELLPLFCGNWHRGRSGRCGYRWLDHRAEDAYFQLYGLDADFPFPRQLLVALSWYGRYQWLCSSVPKHQPQQALRYWKISKVVCSYFGNPACKSHVSDLRSQAKQFSICWQCHKNRLYPSFVSCDHIGKTFGPLGLKKLSKYVAVSIWNALRTSVTFFWQYLSCSELSH